MVQVKALGVRKWLAVNNHGEVRHLELAKLRVTAGLGVQLRDLRWVLSCLKGGPPCSDACQHAEQAAALEHTFVGAGCPRWLGT